jgi:hypothetical protein
LIAAVAFMCAASAPARTETAVPFADAPPSASASATATYSYDSPTASTTHLPNRRAVALIGRPRPESRSSTCASGRVLAAKAGSQGARFVVDASGETRIFVHAGDDALEVTQHAAKRITERGLTVDTVEGVVNDANPFRYYHAGQWKTGTTIRHRESSSAQVADGSRPSSTTPNRSTSRT